MTQTVYELRYILLLRPERGQDLKSEEDFTFSRLEYAAVYKNGKPRRSKESFFLSNTLY